jgi:hypothetical protein
VISFAGPPVRVFLVDCPETAALVYRHTYASVIFGHRDEHVMVVCQILGRCFEQVHMRQNT